jgi:hypothetical protein
MPQIYLAFHGGLAVLRQQNGRWKPDLAAGFPTWSWLIGLNVAQR